MKEAYQAYKEFILSLDSHIYLSARIDLILLLLKIKPCLRTRLKITEGLDPLAKWCQRFDFHYKIAWEDYLYIAHEQELVKQAASIDNSIEAHEQAFGALLGYPPCCCQKIALVGEMNIDHFEEWLSHQHFDGLFQIVNPAAYKEGKAFISHVPCTTSCQASLEQAKRFARFVLNFKEEPLLSGWVDEIEKLNIRDLI